MEASMKITSPAFLNEYEIPRQFTGEGKELSPPLTWTGLPEGTEELALVVDDPDAPTSKPWVHWVIYGIAPNTAGLPQGVPPEDRINTPLQAMQGKNSANRTGYQGPMPPPGHGWHRYFFRLYALNTKLKLKPGITKDELLKVMAGHIIDEAVLMGRYQRFGS
ncbi:MAG: hypothetical protein A2Z97_10760 [Bdellovibrionales bacterium GWB1_52_6]|nr:MAG: hypothetical protein A2Z97_10760 [Bdellovibrionales bacterium GWB1_52_6]OFZ03374.1 MAG: hypothetical protein A2X97_05365 [Bdellovibrionales bacterium GWA1_52_35]